MRFEKVRIGVLVVAFASIVLVVAVSSNVLLNPQKPSSSPTPFPASISISSPSSTSTPNPSSFPTSNPSSITPVQTPTQNTAASETYVKAVPILVNGALVYGGDLIDGAINIDPLIIGESKNVSFCLQSTSNIPTTLWFFATNWNPQGLDSYINLSWDYNDSTLNPGQTIFLTLTLTTQHSLDFANYLSTNNVTTFNFNLVINSKALDS